MLVQPDTSGLYNVGAVFVPTPVKRVPVAPPQSGDRAQEDRRQNQSGNESAGQNKAVFRSILSDATAAGLTRELGKPSDIGAISATDFVRPEKRPASEPISLSNEDVSAAYSYLSGKTHTSASSANESKPFSAEADRYAAASAAYVQNSFEITPAFAAKGEVLELQV